MWFVSVVFLRSCFTPFSRLSTNLSFPSPSLLPTFHFSASWKMCFSLLLRPDGGIVRLRERAPFFAFLHFFRRPSLNNPHAAGYFMVQTFNFISLLFGLLNFAVATGTLPRETSLAFHLIVARTRIFSAIYSFLSWVRIFRTHFQEQPCCQDEIFFSSSTC